MEEIVVNDFFPNLTKARKPKIQKAQPIHKRKKHKENETMVQHNQLT